MTREIILLSLAAAVVLVTITTAVLGLWLLKRVKAEYTAVKATQAAIETKNDQLEQVINEIVRLVDGQWWTVRLVNDETIDFLEIYDLDEMPKHLKNGVIHGKQRFVFCLAINQLDRWCSYRKLYDAARPYNETMRAAGQNKLALSERFIRDTLEHYTFDYDKGGPVIALWHEKETWEDSYNEFYCLTYDQDASGNDARRLVPVSQMVSAFHHEQGMDRLFRGGVEDDTEHNDLLPVPDELPGVRVRQNEGEAS